MKKILLATTILSMSAGFAAADVSMSGSARMGVVSSDGATTFSSRVRAKFSGSGTTEGGLSFGGSFGIQDNEAASGGTAGSIYISGPFGKISMGDVDSGDKAAVGQIDGGVGYTGLGSSNSVGYAADGGYDADLGDGATVNNPDGAKVLYTYSANGLTIAASSGQLSNSDTDHTAFGVGAAYTSGAVTVGLGYGSADLTVEEEDASLTDVSASAGYTMGSTTVKAIYQNKQLDIADVGITGLSTGVSVKNTSGAMSLTAYAITTKYTTDLEIFDNASVSVNRYGVGASYDLGGGAVFAAGWVHNEGLVVVDDTTLASEEKDKFDAGVNFSF